MKRLLLLGAILALIATPLVYGATPDTRVKSILEQLDLQYEINDNGDFILIFTLEDKRTQLCFLNSGTETYEGMEIREIWSPAYKSTGPISSKIANTLLEDSFKKKIGAWQSLIQSDGITRIAIFSAKIDANCDASTLGPTIVAVVKAADEMEQTLSGTDKY